MVKLLFRRQSKEREEINFYRINKSVYLKSTKNSQKFIHLLNIIIFFIMIIIIASKDNQIKLLNFHSSYITLRINKKGNQTFLSKDFNICPDEVYVNDIKISGNICKSIFLNETINKIKLVWLNQINNADYMFYNLNNIKEFNLSNFDASLVVSMNYMFSNCYYLEIIDFSNIQTSLVTSMRYMFEGCHYLTSIILKDLDTSNVVSIERMFANCESLINLDLSNFNTIRVTDMNNLFYFCLKLKSLDLSNFDTSQVTTMSSMFNYCQALISLNISNFDTSKVITMSSMFYYCQALTSLNISNFDTSKVITMSSMFYGCQKIISLNLSNFITSKVQNINGMFQNCFKLEMIDISTFDTSIMTDMGNLFYKCYKLRELNLFNFKTSKVKYMNYMFYYCLSLTSLNINSFDTSNVEEIDYMFSYCTEFQTFNLSHFITNSLKSIIGLFKGCKSLLYINLYNFDTSSVKYMGSLFEGCSNLTSFYIYNFNTSLVKSMSYMFSGCKNFTSFNISNFNFSSVKDISYMFSYTNLEWFNMPYLDTSNVTNMAGFFKGCEKLKSFNLTNFNTSLVQDMSYMFSGCYSLTSFEVSTFDTSSLKNLEGMFYYSYSLKYINLSNFVTSYVTNMKYLFAGCNNLTSINLSNFDTSLVQDMSYMFSGCTSLKSFYEANFITSFVKTMKYMFKDCYSLSSINLSNFDTISMMDMGGLFYGCKNLISLNLSNFDTSLVTDFQKMFYGCSSLKSLNLSNFITKKGIYMNNMFNGCSKLTSLILNNFDTSSVTTMESMFSSCSSLKELDLSSFSTTSVKNIDGMFSDCKNMRFINLSNFIERYYYLSYSNMFYSVPINIVICINANNNPKINRTILNIKCAIIDCSNEWKKNQKKIILEAQKCYNSCKETEKNKYDYENICYGACPDGTYPNDNFVCEDCFTTCQLCEIKGNDTNQNCLKCNEDFSVEVNNGNYFNCCNNCNYYYYYNKEDEFYSTFFYQKDYSILIENTTEIIKKVEIKDIILDLVTNKNNQTKEMSKEEKIKYYDSILQTIESIFTSENYDTSNLDKGEDEVIETEKMIVTLTTTQNQKNNANNNITSIDLGECETLLRNNYSILYNQTIYMKKIEVFQEGMKISKIEYDVYTKLSENKLEKLNLSSCDNNKIYLSIPAIVTDNFDEYNRSSGYYNDICYIATSKSGTDISLNDRKNEYASKALCQDDCDLSNYNYTTQKANCSCNVKETPSSIIDMVIDKKQLLKDFIDIKNIANINILVCYKNLLSKKGIIYNVGFYILSFIIILHHSFLMIFCIKQKNVIKLKIESIKFGILNYELLKSTKNKKNGIMNIKGKIPKKNDIQKLMDLNKKKNKDKNKYNNKHNNKGNAFDMIFLHNQDFNKRKRNKIICMKERSKSIDINHRNNNKKIKNNRIKKNRIYNNITSTNEKKKKGKKKNIKSMSQKNISDLNSLINKEKIIERIRNIMEYTDDEINRLSYELATQYDKRSYLEYYISLIKTRHNFICSFFYNNDYNSKIIKIDIFLISFAIFYFTNGLFFDDHTMHKIYETKGQYNFISQLPKMVYSSLISMALNGILQLLALSNNSIIHFKQNKNKIDIFKRKINLEKILKIRFSIYAVLSHLFLLFFWYYISMFGAIYKNTQYHLLKDSLVSFGMSFFEPFVIYLFPGLFRIPSLSNPKKNGKCLYNVHTIFNIFC